jgi:hypothetical protein
MRRDQVHEEFLRQFRSVAATGILEYLDGEGFVDNVVVGASTMDELLAAGRKVVRANRPSRGNTKPGEMAAGEPRAGDERVWAVSQIAARVAGEDREVIAFRRRYLKDGLLAWEAVEGWIKHESAAAGPPSVYVETVLPDGHELDAGREATRFMPPLDTVMGVTTSARMLAYTRPGGTWTQQVPTVARTSLESLRHLSAGLSKAHAWTEAQATVFVLTGITPYIDAIRMTTGRAPIRDGVECGWGGRIVLTIDPALAPEEVADAYREARRHQGVDKLRQISRRHAILGSWTFDRDEPWADQMREWNSEHPEWVYTAVSNFRRDAARAQRRLMYPAD